MKVTLTLLVIMGTLALTAVAQARDYAAMRRHIICRVFGPYCGQALRVAWCESHFDTNAVNGQYIGLFQMGSHERATYQRGFGGWAQTRGAYRYFIETGRDWSPWSCKPW